MKEEGFYIIDIGDGERGIIFITEDIEKVKLLLEVLRKVIKEKLKKE